MLVQLSFPHCALGDCLNCFSVSGVILGLEFAKWNVYGEFAKQCWREREKAGDEGRDPWKWSVIWLCEILALSLSSDPYCVQLKDWKGLLDYMNLSFLSFFSWLADRILSFAPLLSLCQVDWNSHLCWIPGVWLFL